MVSPRPSVDPATRAKGAVYVSLTETTAFRARRESCQPEDLFSGDVEGNVDERGCRKAPGAANESILAQHWQGVRRLSQLGCEGLARPGKEQD